MARRKDYALSPDKVVEFPVEPDIPWQMTFSNNGRHLTFDFRRWLYPGRPWLSESTPQDKLVAIPREEIVVAMRNAIWRLKETLTKQTVAERCAKGVASWFSFLDSLYEQGESIVSLEQINTELIERYIQWLRSRPAETETGRLSYAGVSAVYTATKSVLVECANAGVLSYDIFPKHCFPNVNRTCKGFKAYSKDEMSRLLMALYADLQEIRRGDFRGIESDKLTVYLLLIAARTGRNPTPLLEMGRDALKPHPLNPKARSLLVVYKRRGNKVSVQGFKRSVGKSIDVEGVATARADVASLFREVLEMTSAYVPLVPAGQRNRLWLHRVESDNPKYKGSVCPLNTDTLHDAVQRLIQRRNLGADATDPGTGKALPLHVTIMRFRKTFAARMWQLTGGDLVKTALALGNKPQVTDTHYLEVTPVMEHQHKFAGHCLEAILRGTEHDGDTLNRIAADMKVTVEEVERVLNGKNNTGVGRCTSPYYGMFAPKDGTRACTKFLYCFQCPNQVIMQSDLYRLFSFYWLVIKERNLMDRKRWKRVYGWVIREVDGTIATRFDPTAVREAREQARISPHPMWRDRALLGGAHA